MRLKREAGLGIGVILTLQIFISMLAIALLTRMGPAIERILQENVYSGEAVEVMLALLAESPPGEVPADFEQALKRARDNVTEAAEPPLLATVESTRSAAFAGDGAAKRELVTALRRLGQVNRDSMNRADVRAQRIGQAGAWAIALLGGLAFALGILVYRRLRLRLELPIEDLRRTVQGIRDGNPQARCASIDGPSEVKQIAQHINWMLDAWLHEDRGGSSRQEAERQTEIRRVLAWLLDRREVPTVVIDADGRRVAAGQDAFELDGPTFDDETLGDGSEPSPWTIQEVPGTSLKVASRDAQSVRAPEAS